MTYRLDDDCLDDFSHIPIYSERLKQYGFVRPSSQYVLYAVTIIGSFKAVRGIRRAYHLLKAAETIHQPNISLEYADAADATKIEIERAARYTKRFASNDLGARLSAPVLYSTWFSMKQIKHHAE
jgi:hypothetical protein